MHLVTHSNNKANRKGDNLKNRNYKKTITSKIAYVVKFPCYLFTDGQNEETELKMVFLGKPAPDDGNADNISNMTQDDTDREEMNSMVPPSDNNNIAQVFDNQPATYKPTPGVGKLSTGGLQ